MISKLKNQSSTQLLTNMCNSMKLYQLQFNYCSSIITEDDEIVVGKSKSIICDSASHESSLIYMFICSLERL